ncbi:hypothetical protein [Pseudonocardia sp. UM4_GMWB1]|uniref:hypothetical protein n=1 Tax=Pseudonocardia sp. UM4_GMWB1 TaxID=2212989 RepID=UPI00307F3C73
MMMPSTSAPAGGLADIDPDTGTVTAVVAVTGVRDDVGDIISAGAFRRTLRERTPRMCVGHDWNRICGRTTSIRELLPGDPDLPATAPDGSPWPRGAGALVATARYLPTRDGREQRAIATAFGKDARYSIGFRVPDGGARHRGDTRVITDCDVYEYSPVLHGANRLAGLQSVKTGAPVALEHKAAAIGAIGAIGTAVHPFADPIAVMRCYFCKAPAAGTLTLAATPTTMVAVTCEQHADALDDLIDSGFDDSGLPPLDSLDDERPAPFATPLTCSHCGQPAGSALAGRSPDPHHDVLCARCVAAIRAMAAGNPRSDDPDAPTTPEDYTAALADETPLTMTADARLVRDSNVSGGVWSPTQRGRRRY